MTDFTQYVRYSCRHCGDECINRLDEDPTRTKECRDCFDELSLVILDPITHHLPESARHQGRRSRRVE